MESAVDRAVALAQCPLFAHAPAAYVLAIAGRAAVVRLHRGEPLALPADAFAVVVVGGLSMVNVPRPVADAPAAGADQTTLARARQVRARVTAGHAVGAIEALANRPPPTAVASEASVLIVVAAAELRLLVADHAPSAVAIGQWLVETLAAIEGGA